MTSSVPGYTEKTWQGDGSTTAFPFQTLVEESGDIRVWLIEDGVSTLQSLTTHYTLSGLGGAGGVTVTFVTAPSATQTVRVARRTVPKQTVDYGDTTKVPGDTTEAQLDRLAMHGQDADTRLNDHEGRIEDIEDDLDAYDDLTDRFLGKYATDALATAAAGSPSEGQIYWNTTSKVFRYYDGSAWQTFPYATVADGAIDEPKQAATLTRKRVAVVADRAELRALDTSRYTTAFLQTDGAEGDFNWDGSDLSGTLLGSDITTTTVNDTDNILTVAGHGLLTAQAILAASAANGLSTNTFYYVIGLRTLDYDAESAAFTAGQTLTGGTSGATATILSVTDAGTTGTLLLKNVYGRFEDNETITDGAGGSATANGRDTIVTDRFQLASSYANALSGTAVSLTGTTNFTLNRHIDPLAGVYVTPTDDLTGASGAWERSYDGVVTPLMFGAVGSGSDESKEMQACLFFGASVYYPPAYTWVIENPLIYSASRECLWSPGTYGATGGAVLFFQNLPDYVDCLTVTGYSDSISGIAFDAPDVAPGSRTWKAIAIDRGTEEDTDCPITDCHFRFFDYACRYVGRAPMFERNTAGRCNNGILHEWGESTLDETDSNRGSSIAGNRFHSLTGYAVVSDAPDWESSQISDNHLDLGDGLVWCKQDITGMVLSGNVVRASTRTIVRFDGICDGLTSKGNILKGFGGTANSPPNIFYFGAACFNTTISDTMRWCDDDAIVFNGTVTNVTINGSQFNDWNLAGNATEDGAIRLNGNTTRLIVTSNQFIGESGDTAVRGTDGVTPSVSDSIYANNTVKDNTGSFGASMTDGGGNTGFF